MTESIELPDGALQHPRREHHLDAIRGFLMCLGIPFHAAYPFHLRSPWVVGSISKSSVLTGMIDFLHLFRMQGFFLLAGYFAAMLIMKREPGVFLRSRLTRLVPPLITALILLVPVMNLLAAFSAHSSAGPISDWLGGFQKPGRQWTGHLWFVVVLIYYNAGLAGACLIFPAAKTFVIEMSDQTANRVLLPLFVVCAVAISLWQGGSSAAVSHLPLVARHPGALRYAVEYLPYFGLGCLLQRCQPLYRRMNRLSFGVAVIGLVAAIYYVGWGDQVPAAVRRVIAAAVALGMVHILLVTSSRLFDADRKWIREMVDASFVIYLFHMPVIVGAFLIVDALAAPVVVRFLILVLVAFVTALLAWQVIKRVPLLKFAFSGVPISTGNRALAR